MAGLLRKGKLSDKERWAREDAELEQYCRWPDEDENRLIIMPEPPDPWQIALKEARGDRRRRKPKNPSDIE